jgi:hypothetical protein
MGSFQRSSAPDRPLGASSCAKRFWIIQHQLVIQGVDGQLVSLARAFATSEVWLRTVSRFWRHAVSRFSCRAVSKLLHHNAFQVFEQMGLRRDCRRQGIQKLV